MEVDGTMLSMLVSPFAFPTGNCDIQFHPAPHLVAQLFKTDLWIFWFVLFYLWPQNVDLSLLGPLGK